MNVTRPTRWIVRAASALALVTSSQWLAGCGANLSAQIRYMHPSPLSRWGNRIRVEPFENEGHIGLSRMIEEAVRRSNAFQMVGEGAQMAVVGEVQVNSAGPEQTGSRPFTCNRLVPEQRTRQVPIVIPGLQPRVELRTEQYTEMVPHPYGCTQLVRSIEARFTVRLRINARTRPIHVVFDRRMELTDHQETLGLLGSDSDDGPPPPVDGQALLEGLYRQAVQRFTQEALPTVETTDVEFADCGDARCEAALTLVRGNQIAAAEAQFTAVIDQFAHATDAAGRRKLAAAYFNRGIVRGYSNQIPEGIDDVRLAVATDGTHPEWQRRLTNLQELQSEIEAARFRGETPGGNGQHPAPRPRGH